MSTLKQLAWTLYGLFLCAVFLLADLMDACAWRLIAWSERQMRRVQKAVGRKL